MRLPTATSAAALLLLIAPGIATADFQHTVAPGESLTSIAAADGLSVSQLAAANGLSPYAQLVAGTQVSIPAQAAPAVATSPGRAAPASESSGVTGDGAGDADDQAAPAAPPAPTAQATTASAGGGDGDGDGDDHGTASGPAAGTGTSGGGGSGSSVVQPGDTLTAIAARAGVSLSALAAANGLDPAGVLPAGRVLVLSPSSAVSSAPSQPPVIGASISGRMTWFGGPNDPSAQGAPASGLGWLGNGMAYYNTGSLGGHWLMRFPWGQTLSMTQIDLGPAPWTGNAFDMAYSALPNTPYSEQTWPNPTVTGTYEGP